MGGFYLCRLDAEGAPDRARLDVAETQFRRHGFATLTPLRTATHAGFHAEPIHGGIGCLHRSGDDFVAVAGTLVHAGKIGKVEAGGEAAHVRLDRLGFEAALRRRRLVVLADEADTTIERVLLDLDHGHRDAGG